MHPIIAMWGLSGIAQDIGGFVTKVVVHIVNIFFAIVPAIFQWLAPQIGTLLSDLITNLNPGLSSTQVLQSYLTTLKYFWEIVVVADYLISVFISPGVFQAGMVVWIGFNFAAITVRGIISIIQIFW